jgi:uncharacterized protein YkwD
VPRFPALILFLVLVPFLCAEAQSADDSASETSGLDFRRAVEKETFLLVNQYRKESGLPPLTWSDAIAAEARLHSEDMATGKVDFGHEGFQDRIDHLKSAMTGIWGAGENVLYTGDLNHVAQTAVTLWLHSPHHLKNIRGDYNYSGLGVWQDKNGTIYFTQLFVKIKAPEAETQAAAPAVETPFGFLASPVTRQSR